MERERKCEGERYERAPKGVSLLERSSASVIHLTGMAVVKRCTPAKAAGAVG